MNDMACYLEPKQTHFHLVSLSSDRRRENDQHAARRLRYCPLMLHETIGLIHGCQMSKQISLREKLLSPSFYLLTDESRPRPCV